MTPEQESEAFRDLPEPEVCRLLASRVRRQRLGAGESQSAFAQRAGISLRTYKRFEISGRANLETFIQVLRALGRTQFLQLLFPSTPPARHSTLDEKIAKLRARGTGTT